MIVRYNTHIIWEGMLVDAVMTPTASGFKLSFDQEDEFGNSMDISIEFDKVDLQQLRNKELFNDPLIWNTIYVIEAQRDGINEKHSYVLAAFLDKEAAISFAELHCTERGGKYSVIVLETEVGKYYEALELPKEVYRAKGRNDNPEYKKHFFMKQHV